MPAKKHCAAKPDILRPSRQFVNTDETELGIEIVTERDQQRPADWPKDFVPIAVFNFTSRGEWYASQNMCPHKKALQMFAQ